MEKWEKYYRYVAAGVLSCWLLTGCSGDAQIQVTDNRQKMEEDIILSKNTQKAGDASPKKDFPAFEYKSVPDNPQTFYLTFPVDMPEKEIAKAWKKISGSPMCEKAAMVERCIAECFLEAFPENINPEYLKWVKDSQGTDEPADTRILEEPGKLRIISVYTMKGTEENLLFGLNPGDSSGEGVSGNLIVNFTAGEKVTILKTVDDAPDSGSPSLSQQKYSLILGKVSTEADWMYDFPGIREERLCLRLCREDFDRIVPEADRVVDYYVKSVKGKNTELRKYIKRLGGYDYEGEYFE